MTKSELLAKIQHLPNIPDFAERWPELRDTTMVGRTQKQHWSRWLSAGYSGPGVYERQNWNRDARFVFNHVQCPDMLIWLAQAAGLPDAVLQAAYEACCGAGSRPASRCGAIRRIIPWETMEQRLLAL